ncbi:MAG: hypothetical protein AAF337_06055 [Pseudomonadota bacterium]
MATTTQALKARSTGRLLTGFALLALGGWLVVSGLSAAPQHVLTFQLEQEAKQLDRMSAQAAREESVDYMLSVAARYPENTALHATAYKAAMKVALHHTAPASLIKRWSLQARGASLLRQRPHAGVLWLYHAHALAHAVPGDEPPPAAALAAFERAYTLGKYDYAHFALRAAFCERFNAGMPQRLRKMCAQMEEIAKETAS